MGEMEFDLIVTKTKKGRHLRSRGTTAKLWESSATRIALGRIGFNGGGELQVANGEGQRGGEKMGARLELYRRAAAAYKEGERGAR